MKHAQTSDKQAARATGRPNLGAAARDRKRPLRVTVNETERADIEARAAAVGLSVSAYLRNCGLGRPMRSLAERQAVDDMLKIHADLGRLAALLDLWLTTRPGQGAPAPDVRAVLQQTRAALDLLLQLASATLRNRGVA